MRMISAYRGRIKTNLGKGYVYDLVPDADGSPSKSMRYYFRERPELRNQLVALLRELKEFLFAEHVLFYDVHDGNIQCRLGENGEFDLIVIDGIGDRARLPILNYFPAIMARKIRHHWEDSVAKMNRRYDWLADFGAL